MKFIPYGRQNITKMDLEEVTKTLKSDFITQGPLVEKFENSVLSYVGANYAIAVNSATSALHIACLALEISKNDVVWVPAISFVATANCVLYCGAGLDFIDVGFNGNISVDSLKEKLIRAKRTNCLPKAVIVVHMCGQPCEMKAIYKLSKEYGFKLIEDASHAIGSEYLTKKTGSCQYSDITIFSFHPVKIITTGEGGMALTNNKSLALKMRLLRSHGITRDNDLFRKKSHGSWYYEQHLLGFNYRLPDINASLGYSQMKRIDKIIKRRHKIFDYYNEVIIHPYVGLPCRFENSKSALHLFPIQIHEDLLIYKKRIVDSLIKKNIGVNVHYIPIPCHPFYNDLGFKAEDYPNALKYYNKSLSLPMFPELTKKDINYVYISLIEILEKLNRGV